MIHHDVGIGQGSQNINLAHVMARHAAYSVFLNKLFVRDIYLGLAQAPQKKKTNMDNKARKGMSQQWNMGFP